MRTIVRRFGTLLLIGGLLLSWLPVGVLDVPLATAAGASGLPANFRDERVAGGNDLPAQFQLNTPTALAFLPDGRMLVTEKEGRIRLIKDGLAQSGMVLNWSAQTNTDGDGGMIGIAVDPNFASNHYLYVSYTSDTPREGRVSRFTMQGDVADPASETVLLRTISDDPSHQIDSVRFGADGYLYASDGDSSPYDMATVKSTRSQQADQTVGKIYRMTPAGQGVATNPFWTGNANDAASKVYALGLRNPFRFTVRPDGTVIVGDVGWNSWEEINKIAPGGGNHNYGWPCYEGSSTGSTVQSAFSNFPVCQSLLPKGTSAVTAPSYAYDHTAGSSVTGGPVYDATVFPSPYKGSYFFADYVKGWIKYWPMDSSGNFVGQPQNFATVTNPVDIELGPDGALYYISISQGQVRRIAYGTATSCSSGNYFAQYYTNQTWSGTPVLARCEEAIDNNWGNGGPFADGQADNFSVSWTGKQYFSKGGSVLTATSDDGMQVWVDGVLVIDNGGIHPADTKSASLAYASGGFHDVVVKYFEASGQASAKLSIVSANKLPVPVISSPLDGTRFASYQTITVGGSATDPEDGALAASTLRWDVILHHCAPLGVSQSLRCHTHPFKTMYGAAGSFQTPSTSGDWIWLEVELTATDSAGAVSTRRVNLYPNLCGDNQIIARYYMGQTWSGSPTMSSCEEGAALNNNWGAGGPFGAGGAVDNFSADWHMPRYFPAGSTTLTATSDDGMQVWVDGNPVIDNNGVHAATSKQGTVTFATAGYHDVYVAYFEAGGDAVAKLDITNPDGCAPGQYLARYYPNETWSGSPAITRCEASVNSNWATGGPFANGQGDNYSAIWTATRYFPAGTTTLTSNSDDGMEVQVDGTKVLDNGGIHPASPAVTGTVTFAASGYHTILVKYFEHTGDASAKLSISNPTSCPQGQLKTSYYPNETWSGSPAITRCEASVNSNWGDTGPFPGFQPDNFSVNWTGSQYFPAGAATVSVTSDDGMQLWVDGTLLIDHNGIHAATTKSAAINFPAAGYHTVVVKYYEHTGQASAVLTLDQLGSAGV